MHRLVYFSNANLDLNLSAIEGMVEMSAERNRPRHISGALLYNGLNFLQILEGPRQALTPLYLQIRTDSRHSGVVKLVHESIPMRSFPDWGMKLVCGAPEYAAATREAAPRDGGLSAMVDGFFRFGQAPTFAELR
ncbi:BLUF domain-containing protein [Methylocystis sp.]|jgi:hypothetical protein|uniref:BLUF domain-containing protein n=1 Tax=Methylocystis sp. TaxID=1911079 RepID=UPI003DA2A5FB